MVIRTLVALVCLPLIFLVIYVLPPIAMPIALALLCAIGVYEALCATNFLRCRRVAVYSILFAALIPFWVYGSSVSVFALAGIFLYVFLLFCEAIASKNTLGLERLGGTFFLTLFIPLALTAFLRIRLWDQWRFSLCGRFCFRRLRLFYRYDYRQAQTGPQPFSKENGGGSCRWLCGRYLGYDALWFYLESVFWRCYELPYLGSLWSLGQRGLSDRRPVFFLHQTGIRH